MSQSDAPSLPPVEALKQLVGHIKAFLPDDWGTPEGPEHQRTFLIAAITYLADARNAYKAAWQHNERRQRSYAQKLLQLQNQTPTAQRQVDLENAAFALAVAIEQGNYAAAIPHPQTWQPTDPVTAEEYRPHAFTSREPHVKWCIWCVHCDYHRDHEIHGGFPTREA